MQSRLWFYMGGMALGKRNQGAQKKTKLLNQQTRSGRQTSIVRLSTNSEGFTRLVRKTAGYVAVPLFPRFV
jgi:hypothetical protein